MSSSSAKLVATIAVVLTILLAFVTYRLSRNYATANAPVQPVPALANAPQATPKTLAVVALKPLAAYQPIAKDDVGLVELSVAPADYFTDLAQVVGRQPLVDVDGGAPVTKRYFGDANQLARAIPPGHQAVSVEINDVVAVGNFIKPGDLVDVLLYLRNSQDVKEAQSRVLLRQVRVLAYEDLLVSRPEGLDEAKDQKDGNNNARAQQQRRTRTAVLAVPETDTTRLMLGASQGELRLALYGQSTPGSQAEPAPEATVAGGLPANSDALAKIESKKVPDKAMSMEELSRIKPPPAKVKSQPIQVPVYRAGEVSTVAVKP